MRHFAGLELVADAIPDESMILIFAGSLKSMS